MKKNKRFIILFLIVISLLIVFWIYYFLSSKYNFYIPCFFHEITNLYCPGCGITRMLFSLVKLNFYQAFRYNALIFISLPFTIYCIVDYLIKFLLSKNNYFYKKISNKVWISILVIVLLFGVLRNIPIFEFLRPTDIM